MTLYTRHRPPFHPLAWAIGFTLWLAAVAAGAEFMLIRLGLN